MNAAVRVRPLADPDLLPAARLHLDVLHMEFLSRFGLAFMRSYYRAWLYAPGAIALAAVDAEDRLVGALLGAVQPAVHTREMVRRHGIGLAARLAVRALGHPALAKDLVVTRGRRYAGGLTRLALARIRTVRAAASPETERTAVGEITHVLVDPDHHGEGIGRALVHAAVSAATAADLDELNLVTPPELEARVFYERLGWHAAGTIVSRSGEHFLRYRFPLRETDPAEPRSGFPGSH